MTTQALQFVELSGQDRKAARAFDKLVITHYGDSALISAHRF